MARTWPQPGRTRPTTSSPLSLPPSPSMSPSPTMLLIAGVRVLIAASLFHTLHNCQVSSAFYPTRLVSIRPIHFWEVTFDSPWLALGRYESQSLSHSGTTHTLHTVSSSSAARGRGEVRLLEAEPCSASLSTADPLDPWNPPRSALTTTPKLAASRHNTIGAVKLSRKVAPNIGWTQSLELFLFNHSKSLGNSRAGIWLNILLTSFL